MTSTKADPSTLCACGSGLTAAHCCELDWARSWPAGEAKALDQARATFAAGDAAAAARMAITVLERSPTHTPALGLLHDIRLAQNQPGPAAVLLGRIARLDPNAPGPVIALALLLFRMGRLEEAEAQARNAVRLAPTDPMAHTLMGMTLTEGQRPLAGEHHYRRVLQLVEKPTANLLANLAWNLKTQGRMAESRTLYEQSFALDPALFNTLFGWARMEEADRQYARAGELLAAADRVSPGNPHLLLQQALLRFRMGDAAGALGAIEDLERRMAGAGDPGLTLDVMKEKGAVLDRLGRHAEAFDAYAQAKRAMREATGQIYQAADAQALAQRLAGFFTGPRMNILPRAGVRADTPQPIFIVGFPRSGTTMIEQMLSGHPRISAGDELPIVGELTALAPRLLDSPMPYPEALADLWLGDRAAGLDLIRDYYLQRARQLGAMEEGADWFTDKMPLNETHLGLIALMFPQAPIVHLIRHPLDVVLSAFANPMSHGFNCGMELATIAQHYVLTMGLVDHYRREIPLRYKPVRYEDVVAAPEPALRDLLAFVGAPYDTACLNFHENRRYARTASYAQVSEPLHDRSLYRYRAYRQQLAPVVPVLAPWIKRLGYAVD
jgi:tetratricopeptide (TPR) repeat protein